MESKNYSGWIFGSEAQQYWMQSLSVGKGRTQKNRFYNPILQNGAHIKWLQAFLDDPSLPFYSYIIFSDRCELKKITLTSDTHNVLNRYGLWPAIRRKTANVGNNLTYEEIDRIFERIYPLSQVGDDEKERHIKNIQNANSHKARHRPALCSRKFNPLYASSKIGCFTCLSTPLTPTPQYAIISP